MNNTNENEEMDHWAKHYTIAYNRGFITGLLIGGLLVGGLLVGFGTLAAIFLV